MKTPLLFFIILFFSLTTFSQSITGTWKTYDDETGTAKSHVKIWKGTDDKYYGKIIKLLDADDQSEVCSKCEGNKKDQPIIGMVIIDGLEKDDEEYEDGTILDPNNGKVYDCKLWLEDGKLQVRVYWGWFYRTQTWEKVQ